MFTGIVEEVGTVQEITPGHLTIDASTVMDDLKVSDSINVNGTCLTVTKMLSLIHISEPTRPY